VLYTKSTGTPAKTTFFRYHSRSLSGPGKSSMSYRSRRVQALSHQLQPTTGRRSYMVLIIFILTMRSFPTGTRTSGAKMHTCSIRKDGSMAQRKRRRLRHWECTPTCKRPFLLSLQHTSIPDFSRMTFLGGVRACIGWRFA